MSSKINKMQTASAAAAGGLENADMDEIILPGEEAPQIGDVSQ